MARSLSLHLRNILLFCGLLMSLPGGSSAAEPTISDVVAGVKATNAKVKSFSVKIGGEGEVRLITNKGLAPALTQTPKLTAEFTWAAPNRFAYEYQNKLLNSDGTLSPEQFHKGAFNGKLHKEIFGENATLRGWVRPVPQSLPLGFSAEDIFFTFMADKLTNILSEKGVQFEPTTVVKDKGECVILTPSTKGVDGVQRRYRLTASPARGFSIVRREALQFVVARKVWLPYSVEEFDDYKQSDAGVWTPGKLTQTDFIIDQTQDKPSKVLSKKVYKLSGYIINKKYPDSTFEIVFPPMIPVKDFSTENPPVEK